MKEKEDGNWKSVKPIFKSFSKIPANNPGTVSIPFKVFKKSLKRHNENSFIKYLNQLIGEEEANALIKRFYIGTSKYWEGSTVFWLIDEKMKIRGGQVILFDKHGNTKIVKREDGSKKRFNGWVHTALKKHYEKQNQPLPEWLQKYYDSENPKSPCLFGLPQLKNEPLTKPIAIVESAKTAIIATAYPTDYIWLATGGLSYLNIERMQCLKGRNITLFPDKGGFEKWSEKSKDFRDFANVNISDLLERKEVKQGMDIADFLTQYSLSDFCPNTQSNKDLPNGWFYDTWTCFDGVEVTNLINNVGYPANWS
jgi:hypothetical protein